MKLEHVWWTVLRNALRYCCCNRNPCWWFPENCSLFCLEGRNACQKKISFESKGYQDRLFKFLAIHISDFSGPITARLLVQYFLDGRIRCCCQRTEMNSTGYHGSSVHVWKPNALRYWEQSRLQERSVLVCSLLCKDMLTDRRRRTVVDKAWSLNKPNTLVNPEVWNFAENAAKVQIKPLPPSSPLTLSRLLSKVAPCCMQFWANLWCTVLVN